MKILHSLPSASRRRFMRDALRTAVGVGAVTTVLSLQTKQSKADTSGVPIRPPGALKVDDFLNSC